MMDEKLKAIRTAFADYDRCTGCGCCGDEEGKKEAKRVLAGLLEVPMYPDGSGYRFWEFASDDEYVARLRESIDRDQERRNAKNTV